MKPFISPKVHGALDYGSAVLLLVLAAKMPGHRPVQMLLRGAAVITVLYSFCTRYPLGALPWLSLESHLKADRVQASVFLLAPRLFPQEEEWIIRLLVAVGVFENTVVSLTAGENELQKG